MSKIIGINNEFILELQYTSNGFPPDYEGNMPLNSMYLWIRLGQWPHDDVYQFSSWHRSLHNSIRTEKLMLEVKDKTPLDVRQRFISLIDN